MKTIGIIYNSRIPEALDLSQAFAQLGIDPYRQILERELGLLALPLC